MGKPHVHAELIKAWVDGAEIQCIYDGAWTTAINPVWSIGIQYRIKPEREYPKTTLTAARLSQIYDKAARLNDDRLEAIANAAIKQHIIDEEAKNG